MIEANANAAFTGKVLTPGQSQRDSINNSFEFGYDDLVEKVLILPNGKIVAAGWSTVYHDDGVFELVRYNADGSLDKTFGKGGKVLGGGTFSRDAVLLADGKLLVSGEYYSLDDDTREPLVVRYNADGSLDKTFGADGVFRRAGTSITLQADGKFLLRSDGAGFDVSLSRYNPDASPDKTFGKNGSVVLKAGGDSGAGGAVSIQPDGRIVLSGSISTGAKEGGDQRDFAIARYNADGSPDKTFGKNGAVVTSVGTIDDRGGAIMFQADGKILLYGTSKSRADGDFAVVRYNADGSLDKSFGKGGKAVVPVGKADDNLYTAALQSDGKILLGGKTSDGMFGDFALVRLNADGSLDKSFGGNGKVTTPVGPFDDYATSIALRPDGKIVVGGNSNNGVDQDFAIVRYNADGSLDRSFGDAVVARPMNENTQIAAALPYFDLDGDKLSWSITGGPDAKLFTIDMAGTGSLKFKSAPDFEAPKDSDKNNIYAVTLKASDGENTRTETLQVRIVDIKNVSKTGGSGDDTLVGDAEHDVLKGLEGRDFLYGGAGDDKLLGGTGRDVLEGGPGRDTFVFDTALHKKSNVDDITGFSHEDDTFQLDSAIFKGLPVEVLKDYRFKIIEDAGSKEGIDRSDRILYDKADGNLYFDQDGSGSKYSPTRFAVVKDNADVRADDFLIV